MRAFIVEDEAKNRALLRKMLALVTPQIEVVGEASDGGEGLDGIRLLQPDVVFLDIKMPGLDGFSLLDQLSGFEGKIVFVTAYQEYAIRAIRYAAFDYLLKPIDPEELQKTMQRLEESGRDHSILKRIEVLESQLASTDKSQGKITINSQEGFDILSIAEIVYMEADGPYTHFYLTDGSHHISSRHLKEYEGLLPDTHFFRCHHSFLVALRHIRKYNRSDNLLYLIGGFQIEVSKRKKEAFIQRISKM